MTSAQERHLRLRLQAAPGHTCEVALQHCLAHLSPPARVVVEERQLRLSYTFPGVTLAGVGSALLAAGCPAPTLPDRCRLALRTMLEQNEKELLQAKLGWRACMDEIYATAAVANARGGRRQQWQEYERKNT